MRSVVSDGSFAGAVVVVSLGVGVGDTDGDDDAVRVGGGVVRVADEPPESLPAFNATTAIPTTIPSATSAPATAVPKETRNDLDEAGACLPGTAPLLFANAQALRGTAALARLAHTLQTLDEHRVVRGGLG